MAAEIDNGRASHAQLSEQKLALAERLNATEHTLTALREEIRQREDDFQVGVGGPPPRACLLRRARPRTARGHRPFAPRVLQPLHRLRRASRAPAPPPPAPRRLCVAQPARACAGGS